jgi:predicted dehydrogenase
MVVFLYHRKRGFSCCIKKACSAMAIEQDVKQASCLSVGIVGVGSISEIIHIPVLQTIPNVRIGILVDPYADEKKMEKLSRKLGCPWSRNLDALDTDLAVIATPISTHCEIGKALAAQRINLFVEKPLGHKFSDAQTLLELAKTHDCRVFCGQMRRFYGNVVVARLAVSSGLLGDIRRISIFEGNLYGWKRSYFNAERTQSVAIDEGVLFDVGTHAIDTTSFVIEGYGAVLSVATCITDTLDLATNVEIQGDICVLGKSVGCWSAAFSNSVALSNCIWFHGTTGTLMLSANASLMPRFYPSGQKEYIVLGTTPNAASPFLRQYHAIIRSLRAGGESIIDGTRVLDTVRVLDTAWAKVRSGQCSWLF